MMTADHISWSDLRRFAQEKGRYELEGQMERLGAMWLLGLAIVSSAGRITRR
jgi:hypothetical protein